MRCIIKYLITECDSALYIFYLLSVLIITSYEFEFEFVSVFTYVLFIEIAFCIYTACVLILYSDIDVLHRVLTYSQSVAADQIFLFRLRS